MRKSTRNKETRTMTKRKKGTRKEWLAVRLDLLKAEKELTRRSDELAKRRQELPWVKIDKNYQFMFGPDYKAGCPSCSAIADGFDGIAVHLANHDVMLWAVSRAPLPKLQEYKRRMGWTFPWASSFGSDFNFDFNASFTEEQQRKGIEYNYRREEPVADIPSRSTADGPTAYAAAAGTDVDTYTRERPGLSTFVLEDGVVYHTYSAYSRGVDALWSMYQWLDRAPKGRNEDGDLWWRRRDEYKKA